MRRTERIHAIEATRLLNAFVGDLVIGSLASGWLDVPSIRPVVTEELKITMRRMCVWHVILTLSKWQEVYDCYNQVFPIDVRKASQTLCKELDRRGVRSFRNIVVGHILDKKTKRPILATEINAKLTKIFNGSPETFLLWVNNPDGNHFPDTVVGIVEHVRDRLMQDFSITKQELFPHKVS